MTHEQKQYIEQEISKGRKHKDIAAEIGISKFNISIYLNKKRRYKQDDSEFFQVELISAEHTWLI